MNGGLNPNGDLHAEVIRGGMTHVGGEPGPNGLYEHHGLVGDLTRFSNDALGAAKEEWKTALHVLHLDKDGNVKGQHHLGPGLTTNVGAQALANDFAWAAGFNTTKLANWHASGTGATAAAASDIALQTSAGPSPVSGTQSLVSAANVQIYKTVATMAYVSTLAITEWGLFLNATLSATTGTPLTAVTANTATVTGTPYTASSGTVQGEQQFIIKTGTTASYMLILSNTTSVLTGAAWYKVADGTLGTTPGSTEAFTLLPVMTDHKVFAAVNVVSGDSIQFSYSETFGSGT